MLHLLKGTFSDFTVLLDLDPIESKLFHQPGTGTGSWVQVQFRLQITVDHYIHLLATTPDGSVGTGSLALDQVVSAPYVEGSCPTIPEPPVTTTLAPTTAGTEPPDSKFQSEIRIQIHKSFCCRQYRV